MAGKETFALWHKRLGHPSLQTMGHLPHITRDKINFDITTCNICHRSKQTRNIFPLSENKENSLFELIHCDVWGPYRENRACNSRYCFTIVDDFSRSVWVYLMKTKNEVPSLMLNFLGIHLERKVGIYLI